MSELDIRSLGMVASRMLTNYLKTKEREEAEGGRVEEEDYFDQSYLEVSEWLFTVGHLLVSDCCPLRLLYRPPPLTPPTLSPSSFSTFNQDTLLAP